MQTGETVSGVEHLGECHFRVLTTSGSYETRRVILAIGRRGVPRKLGIPGEESSRVAYALREPEAYSGDEILVVGGGDSAVEAALALAEQPGNAVRVSYRKSAFSRIKPKNHERMEAARTGGEVEVLFETSPTQIYPEHVALRNGKGPVEVTANQIFVFIGGELPTPFLRSCGIEIETKFGTP